MTKGWWDMHCWNALSGPQQRRLIEVGNLPIFSEPEAVDGCTRPATVALETSTDEAPGPRFYCSECAVAYLAEELNTDEHTAAAVLDHNKENR